jgi:hypothetical protein
MVLVFYMFVPCSHPDPQSLTDDLQVAAQANNFALVECLLNKGLNANTANDEGE